MGKGEMEEMRRAYREKQRNEKGERRVKERVGED